MAVDIHTSISARLLTQALRIGVWPRALPPERYCTCTHKVLFGTLKQQIKWIDKGDPTVALPLLSIAQFYLVLRGGVHQVASKCHYSSNISSIEL
jgi:hypothetical protein